MSFELIDSVTLTNNQDDITFSNIPQDGDALMIEGRINIDGEFGMFINAQDDFSHRWSLDENDDNDEKYSSGFGNSFTLLRNNNPLARTRIYLYNYTSTQRKNVLAYTGNMGTTNVYSGILSGTYYQPLAATDITLGAIGAGNFEPDTFIRLYKITAE